MFACLNRIKKKLLLNGFQIELGTHMYLRVKILILLKLLAHIRRLMIEKLPMTSSNAQKVFIKSFFFIDGFNGILNF